MPDPHYSPLKDGVSPGTLKDGRRWEGMGLMDQGLWSRTQNWTAVYDTLGWVLSLTLKFYIHLCCQRVRSWGIYKIPSRMPLISQISECPPEVTLGGCRWEVWGRRSDKSSGNWINALHPFRNIVTRGYDDKVYPQGLFPAKKKRTGNYLFKLCR